MSIETYQFLSEDNIKVLASSLITKSNIRIGERIVTTVDENSTDKQVASARALYKLISQANATDANIGTRLDNHDTQLSNDAATISSANEYQVTQNESLSSIETNLDNLSGLVEALTHITYTSVIGDISTVTDPKSDIMYLQKDDENDPSWMIYIHYNGTWINVGDTEVDLTVIWSKNEVNELREALEVHEVEAIPDDDILAIIEESFSASAEDLT